LQWNQTLYVVINLPLESSYPETCFELLKV
jgi:hypothetical protein